jgi:phosphonate transport system substrate-binding protein
MNPLRPLLALCLLAALQSACAGERQEEGAPGEAESAAPAWREDSVPPTCQLEDQWPATIRIGVTPYVGQKVMREEFQGIVDYLSKELKHPCAFVTSEGYADLVEKMKAGEVDIVSLAPLSYVRAKAGSPCTRLLLTQVSKGNLHYSSYIMVRAGTDITAVADLRGRPFAYASEDSASGYLFPRAFLLRQGLNPDTLFGRVEFGGDHLATIRLLAEGKVEAAATFARTVQLARLNGIDTGRLRVLAVTGRIPYDAVCARPGLNAELADRVQEALLRLNFTTDAGRQILEHEMELNGWVRTSDALYDPVRDILDLVGAEGSR